MRLSKSELFVKSREITGRLNVTSEEAEMIGAAILALTDLVRKDAMTPDEATRLMAQLIESVFNK